MLINKHEKCWGLKLFKWKQYQIELWWCPKGYKILEHSHPNVDIKLMFIAGEATFVRNRGLESATKKVSSPEDTFTAFTIKAGDNHYFEVASRSLIFINFEKWRQDFKPTSAAKDFQLKGEK